MFLRAPHCCCCCRPPPSSDACACATGSRRMAPPARSTGRSSPNIILRYFAQIKLFLIAQRTPILVSSFCRAIAFGTQACPSCSAAFTYWANNQTDDRYLFSVKWVMNNEKFQVTSGHRVDSEPPAAAGAATVCPLLPLPLSLIL